MGTIASGMPVETHFTYWLLRPYFDLEPSPAGPLMNWGPLLAYEVVVTGQPLPGTQRILIGPFRRNLVEQTGLSQYAVSHPAELPETHRTERWQHLVELTKRFTALTPRQQLYVGRLLVYLGFHTLVLRLIPRYGASEIASSPEVAALAGLRAFASNVLHHGKWDSYDPQELELVVTHAPPGPTRFYTANTLLVYHAKVTRNLMRVRECRSIMAECLEQSRKCRESFDYLMDVSRFYRSASFLPFLEGRREQVVQEMDTAERLARELLEKAETQAQQVVARENMHPVLESRMREALWLGDWDLALERMRELVQIDPWDAKAYVELGQLLAQRGELEEATQCFLRAARYGPPGTAVAYYLAGWCYEQGEDLEQACQCYMAALRIDPEGISALQGLVRCARRLGHTPLVEWCAAHAARLESVATASEEDRRELATVRGWVADEAEG